MKTTNEINSRVGGRGAATYSTASSALEATEWGGGLNWHLDKNVKVSADYLNTSFKGGGQAITDVTAHGAQVILTRVQLAF